MTVQLVLGLVHQTDRKVSFEPNIGSLSEFVGNINETGEEARWQTKS